MTSKSGVTRFTHAIVRAPARSVTSGLRALEGDGPQYERVAAEHTAYVSALARAGLSVTALPALEAFPDSVFVEDPALVFPEGAIVLRPGAPSRFCEAPAIEPVLRAMFPQVLSLPDGHVDGGDILMTQNKVMIGLSARTDETGAEALMVLLASLGRKGEVVRTPSGVLHFKSDCSLIDENVVLASARISDAGVFDGMEVIVTPAGEEAAANALCINDHVLISAGFPKTSAILKDRGLNVLELETSAIALIDAGLSCMSLRW